MRHHWAITCFVVLTGCLAAYNHDGPWPCRTDADCDSGLTCQWLGGQGAACYPPGSCLDDADCWPLGRYATCQSAACVCPDVCGGTCTDTSVDVANCGACGHVCGELDICRQGTCVCDATACPNGTCVDTEMDDNNCGGCGVTCPSGVSCTWGNCGCPAGLTPCPGGCTDTQTDWQNCGGCFNRCPNGCQFGSCM
jgi:hypothetical protein